MTRTSPSPTVSVSPSMAAPSMVAPFMMGVMFIPLPVIGAPFALPAAMFPGAPCPAPAGAAAAAPVADPAPAKSSSSPATAPAPTPPPPPPPPRNPGAGLPAPLVALLRDESGPFLANEVFSVTPPEPLAAIEEEVPAPEWYAITRGRFVGVVDQFALSHVAISGVAHGARKAYTTQGLALAAFNQALTWGGVQVA
ncbi:hypothetical protein DFH06DRAFT_1127671 [Mycena polygramma]|nr:hypothetical protein DFH06DRAFT_1127671 [Mycena polygramma]